MVKSADEMATIRASVQLNSAALEQALEQFRPGMTEVDLAAEIDYRMRLLGADGTAFDTIVASGARTALPHAHPTAHPISANELLLIDMGAQCRWLCQRHDAYLCGGQARPEDTANVPGGSGESAGRH